MKRAAVLPLLASAFLFFAIGTARAQLHLRQILAYLDVPALTKPEIFIINGWEKFDSEGHLIDEQSRQLMKTLLEKLVKAAKEAREKAAVSSL